MTEYTFEVQSDEWKRFSVFQTADICCYMMSQIIKYLTLKYQDQPEIYIDKSLQYIQDVEEQFISLLGEIGLYYVKQNNVTISNMSFFRSKFTARIPLIVNATSLKMWSIGSIPTMCLVKSLPNILRWSYLRILREWDLTTHPNIAVINLCVMDHMQMATALSDHFHLLLTPEDYDLFDEQRVSCQLIIGDVSKVQFQPSKYTERKNA